MTLLARRPTRSFTIAPEGLHPAVCVDVQDLGLQAGPYGPKHKVRLVWQLDSFDAEHDRRHDVARVYTLSLHERAALRKDLESWRGRKFTEAELDGGFNLERLLGCVAQVQVAHTLGDDGSTYANVLTVLPPVKGSKKLVPLNYVRLKDRVASRGNGSAAAEAVEDDPVPF